MIDVEQLITAAADAPALACFLDYDGTLAPIAATPAEALPYPGTHDLLTSLCRLPATSVALVSGRTIDNLKTFLDLPNVTYVGIHGVQFQAPGAPIETNPAAAEFAKSVPALEQHLGDTLKDVAGLLLENKTYALTCHYRQVAAAEIDRVRQSIVEHTGDLKSAGIPIVALDGHKSIELRAEGINKGRAVMNIWQQREDQPTALYMGDDRTDEDAFRALPTSSITVRIGPAGTETAAQALLPDPAAVHAMLSAICERRG